jgi:murein DD-endopeptidase MepM/ murein hydrolase activator NlpD
MNFKNIYFFIFCGLSLFAFGCAGPTETLRVEPAPVKRQGVYHKVEPKETLWRIAKAYGISVEELVSANNIPDAAHIQENQLILIPNASAEKPIVSNREALTSEEFKWPIKGRIVSYFGDAKISWVNNGIEIKSESSQQVFPSRGGEVVFADYLNGYGDTVIIDHVDGYQTVYAKTSSLLVAPGEYVTPQTPIANVGGDNEALALLHFEIRKDSKAKNPLYFLP